MKKSLFLLAGAALILSSCMDDQIRQDINNGGDENLLAIDFRTFAEKATRAENSGATLKNGLGNYHNTFALWGAKYVNGTRTEVFTNQQVNKPTSASADASWSYSPLRFWDKSAEKYDFFAAAPFSADWEFNASSNAISIEDFTVDGATLAPMMTCSADAVMPNNKDIMIATDVVREFTATSKDYSQVQLLFNHILSRMNIAVRKATILDDFIVRMDGITVYNLLQKGTFDEDTASADASGSSARWTSTSTKYNFGYTASGDGLVSSGDAYKYFYQGLVIPQIASYEAIPMDGPTASSSALPYIKIAYTFYTASGEAEIAVPGGKYEYYYNLADIFNGKDSASGDAVEFCEGYMNNLLITIHPDAIEFCPQVYNWDTYQSIPVEVPNINK